MHLLHMITHLSHLHNMKFCKCINGKGKLLLAGAEDKKLSIYTIPDNPASMDPPTVIAKMVRHSVETLSITLPESLGSNQLLKTIVCTISFDGKIFVYNMASPSPSKSR